jgi:hypothetical protein
MRIALVLTTLALTAAGPGRALGETPSPEAPSPEAPSPKGSDLANESTFYSWEDAEGGLHYTYAAEIPADRRRTARPVQSSVGVLSMDELPAPRESAASVPPAASEAAPAQPAPPPAPEENHHMRAVRAAGDHTLDPAAVQQRYEQQLQDMKCRTVDGAVICG